jgi:arylsulfatase A-like enzyme
LAATGAGAACLALSKVLTGAPDQARRPNIVYILADDLGYGDVKCLNPTGKIATPHLDALAREGMVFTDAHSPSAVCTPTRYGVLTGRYCWRSRLKAGVLNGFSPAIVEPGRMTVASLLRDSGYGTACIGKWHLGLDWAKTGQTIDYTKPVANGPGAAGFDYFYGIAASLDMPPYVYIKNDRAVAVPTVRSAAFGRPGAAMEGLKPSDVLGQLTKKAVEYLGRQSKDTPFFLYFPLTAPHTPIAPSKAFAGRSGLGPYGDFVCEVDWVVAQVLRALEKNGLADNTLVIFTSDNGCSPAAGFKNLAGHGHYPSYHFRGYKADIFEGGHRIPFIVRWPGKVARGSSCAQTICLTDLLATAAGIVERRLPDTAGEDSVSILPALLGKSLPHPLREATVHHSINGSFSIRQGKWKLELCPGSGGWSEPRPAEARKLNLPPVQLYDLEKDVGEKNNVHKEHPEVVRQMTDLLAQYVRNGRSTPGAPQKNAGGDSWPQLNWMHQTSSP